MPLTTVNRIAALGSGASEGMPLTINVVAKLGVRAMISGLLAGYITATIAGILI